MIKSYSREDLLIGFFVLFALLYPFFITLLIFLEEVREKNNKMQELRAFYSFLLGLEECRQERAQELSGLMAERLSQSMGGAEGLLKTCNAYRKAYPSARAEEKTLREGELQVELIKKEKGMTQRLLSVRLYYGGEGESLKIEKVEYEKGN
ncbi:MAG: hypothetical protein NZ560_03440 [Aquificaceae bacterium]|nr:hypothetical protein [Aquificaceae bacterium]MDW8096746.1 hypothetical protein [Aquificaceae bacterium]